MRRSHPAPLCLLMSIWAGDSFCNLIPGLALHTEKIARATHFAWVGCPVCFDSRSISAGPLFLWAVAVFPEARKWQLLPPDAMHLSGSGEETRVDVWILCLRIFFLRLLYCVSSLKDLKPIKRSESMPHWQRLVEINLFKNWDQHLELEENSQSHLAPNSLLKLRREAQRGK